MSNEISVLSGADLMKIYGKRKVVNNVSLNVHQGEIVGLLGPNGAGKTTTFYIITGMIRPNDGHVKFDDKEITKFPMYKRSRFGIAYLPQEASIFRKLTVRENLLAIMQMIGLSKQEQSRKCDQFLSELSITHIADSMGYNLSGGERRRTEIARTLVTDPKFILLDEPFAGVDPIAVEDIQSIIHSLKERGIGVLITDHNVHETLSITDRAYLLFQGQILREGTSDALAGDEQVRKLYLGENFKLDR